MGLALQLLEIPIEHLPSYAADIYEDLDYLHDHWYFHRPGAHNSGLAGEVFEHDPDIFRDMCREFEPYSTEVSAFCDLAANIVMHIDPARQAGLTQIFTNYGWPSPATLVSPAPEILPPSDMEIASWTAVPEVLPESEIYVVDESDAGADGAVSY